MLMSAAAVLPAAAVARVHVLLSLAVAAAVYLALSVLLRAFTAEELQIAWRKKNGNRCRVRVRS